MDLMLECIEWEGKYKVCLDVFGLVVKRWLFLKILIFCIIGFDVWNDNVWIY